MKKLLLILLCLPFIGFGQLTYVPDDVFEEYIETNFPLADNGIVNDDYVLTAGLDATAWGTGLSLTPTNLSSPIISDFTGIEDFVGLTGISITNLNMTTIDLSQAQFTETWAVLYNGNITIESCPLLQELILPSDSINLYLNANTYLQSIIFQNQTYINNRGIFQGVRIMGCSSLLSIDMSNILGVFNGSLLNIISNPSLSQLNLKNGFCYNWGDVYIVSNPNLFCIQVDDPNYSSISANWFWDGFVTNPSQYNYSTNCGWPSAIEEQTTNKELLKLTDLLGRETKQTNQPLFYIYDDGTVEKKLTIE